MRLIDAEALYKKVDELEDLARQRVIDTPQSFPDGSLNPTAIRYLAQLSERTTMKEIVRDFPSAYKSAVINVDVLLAEIESLETTPDGGIDFNDLIDIIRRLSV